MISNGVEGVTSSASTPRSTMIRSHISCNTCNAYSSYIPQTDLSVGVLTVLYQRGYDQSRDSSSMIPPQ